MNKKTNVRYTFKDRLFRMIFSGKEELLSLYNAMNHSSYGNPEDLEIYTIEDVLYMGMKNDVSFLIDEYLNLYEAQASWNPNMPLRGLFYFSRMYQGYMEERHLDLYSRVQLKLPVPRYVVFYNGTEKMEEKQKLCLSDSYLRQDEAVLKTWLRAAARAGSLDEFIRQCSLDLPEMPLKEK